MSELTTSTTYQNDLTQLVTSILGESVINNYLLNTTSSSSNPSSLTSLESEGPIPIYHINNPNDANKLLEALSSDPLIKDLFNNGASGITTSSLSNSLNSNLLQPEASEPIYQYNSSNDPTYLFEPLLGDSVIKNSSVSETFETTTSSSSNPSNSNSLEPETFEPIYEGNSLNDSTYLLPPLLDDSVIKNNPVSETSGTTTSSSNNSSNSNSLLPKTAAPIHTGNHPFSVVVKNILGSNITYVNIHSISEDTGVNYDFWTNYDFKTTDNTLVFKGASEAGNTVEGFLKNIESGEQFSIGSTVADKSEKWSLDYSQYPIPDGQYKLSVKAIDSKGNIDTAQSPKLLVIDTDYDIEPDVTDKSINSYLLLHSQINKAIKYWKDIIKNDIPDHNGIDDLKIKFVVSDKSFDGLGGQLANTGGYSLRPDFSGINDYDPITGKALPNSSYLPSYAVITIDSADINTFNTYYGLITLQHEIAHAIGFNSFTFASKELIHEFSYGKQYYGFIGENSLITYHALGGNINHTSVPLENTNPGHWNELLFPDSWDEAYTGFMYPDELMTSESRPLKNPILSKLTLAAFMDLGFQVDMTKGDSYKIDSYLLDKIPY